MLRDAFPVGTPLTPALTQGAGGAGHAPGTLAEDSREYFQLECRA